MIRTRDVLSFGICDTKMVWLQLYNFTNYGKKGLCNKYGTLIKGTDLYNHMVRKAALVNLDLWENVTQGLSVRSRSLVGSGN